MTALAREGCEVSERDEWFEYLSRAVLIKRAHRSHKPRKCNNEAETVLHKDLRRFNGGTKTQAEKKQRKFLDAPSIRCRPKCALINDVMSGIFVLRCIQIINSEGN